jgi:hypothetical protein
VPIRKSDPAFYVGRESFKMKVVQTPAAPMASPAAAARTPPPKPTPPRPISNPPPVTTPYPRKVTAELSGGITMAKATFAGFCLTAFAFGIVTAVLIDRVWPRRYEEPAAMRLEPLPVPAPRAPKPFVPEIRELPSAGTAPAKPPGTDRR